MAEETKWNPTEFAQLVYDDRTVISLQKEYKSVYDEAAKLHAQITKLQGSSSLEAMTNLNHVKAKARENAKYGLTHLHHSLETQLAHHQLSICPPKGRMKYQDVEWKIYTDKDNYLECLRRFLPQNSVNHIASQLKKETSGGQVAERHEGSNQVTIQQSFSSRTATRSGGTSLRCSRSRALI